MQQISDIVTAYYPRIDANDVKWVLSLFTDDAVYERADASYGSLSAIQKFFTEDRQIRGLHIIEDLWHDEANKKVFVTGQFVGTGAKGDPRSVCFADMWQFNDKKKVTKRKTYLSLGHTYVER